jgi:hypothetical protein
MMTGHSHALTKGVRRNQNIMRIFILLCAYVATAAPGRSSEDEQENKKGFPNRLSSQADFSSYLGTWKAQYDSSNGTPNRPERPIKRSKTSLEVSRGPSEQVEQKEGEVVAPPSPLRQSWKTPDHFPSMVWHSI